MSTDTEFTGTGVGNITGITYFADFEAYKKLLFVSHDSSSAIIELYQVWDSRIFPNILLAPDSEEEINGVDDNEELSQLLHDLHVQESTSNACTAPIITPVPISSHSFSSSGATVSDSQATEPVRNVSPITDAMHIDTDATHVNTDTMRINTDAVCMDTAATCIDTAAACVDTAAMHIDNVVACTVEQVITIPEPIRPTRHSANRQQPSDPIPLTENSDANQVQKRTTHAKRGGCRWF